MIASTIYILCALTSLLCTFLLLRGYRKTKARLLLWSGLCFVGLALNNIILIVDLLLFPDVDLSLIREIPALVGLLLLLFGMIWDTE